MKIDLQYGDCLGLMKDVRDQSIDLILCDLPYGTTQNKWDSVIPFADLWAAYNRICRGAIVLTAAQPFTSALIMSNVDNFKYQWVWVKTQSRGHLNAYKMPMRKHEDVCVFYCKQPTYNPQITKKATKDIRKHSKSGPTDNYSNFDGDQSKNRKIAIDEKLPEDVIVFANQQRGVHPTQKPVALMEYLIKTYTNEGDTVLDNCMGSGTTGVACVNTGRNFIGMEQEFKYFRIARQRIKEAGGEL